MAAVFTEKAQRDLGGGLKMVVGSVAMDATYPTGGETLDMSTYFKTDVYMASFGLGTAGGYVLTWDGGTAAAGKVMAYWADYDAVADGALIQVANATDLSAITACECMFIGA